MTKQLSIFLENKSGTMLKVLKVFKETGIRIIASSVSDTVEYGIYRIICDRPDLAYKELKARSVSVTFAEVFALQFSDTPGRAADAISLFAEAGISINYMYSFLLDGKGVLVFKTDDIARTEEIISQNALIELSICE